MNETATVKLDPARWVDEHGDCLYRYALARVRTPEAAEDLVQDTLLVAVRSQDRFAGRSSERSWLVGILKHKIVDYYRRLKRETTFTDLEFLKDEFSHKFIEGGWWNHDFAGCVWCRRYAEQLRQIRFFSRAFPEKEVELAPAVLSPARASAWLRDLHCSHHPAKGAFSVCMHRDDAGTVSATELAVDRSSAAMTYAAGPACAPGPRLGFTLPLRLPSGRWIPTPSEITEPKET